MRDGPGMINCLDVPAVPTWQELPEHLVEMDITIRCNVDIDYFLF